MTITTAEYKAAIEAKIAAASGATALKDLTLIKTNADLWLLNNSGGSIVGYASLESLIQDKQDDLTGSSTINDVSFVGVSAFPPAPPSASAGSGFTNKDQITTSSSWTVPADVYEIFLLATGGGGAGGGGGNGTSNENYGASGGAAGSSVGQRLIVAPGQVLQIVIGAGGSGVSGGSGNGGGNTTVRMGPLPAIIAYGGKLGVIKSDITISNDFVGASIGRDGSAIYGGDGAAGRFSAITGVVAGSPKITGIAPLTAIISTVPVAAAASGGTNHFAGGGGGSSIYGPGGAGGNGGSSAGGNAGVSATSTNYGAGGGGSSGITTGGSTSGGNGANGIVEIYY